MKFKVGDKVTYKGEKCFITHLDQDDNEMPYLLEKINGEEFDNESIEYWVGEYEIELTTPEYKTGDKVLVRDYVISEWTERVFVCEYNGMYWCIFGDEGRFGSCETNEPLNAWKQIKPLEDKLDIALTCTVNGEEVPLSDISEETLLAIRNKSK